MKGKFFLGILAFSPVTYLVILLALEMYPEPEADNPWLISFHLLVLSVAFLFMIHVPFNRHVQRGKKGLWATLLLFGNLWVFPFYWYIHVRRTG